MQNWFCSWDFFAAGHQKSDSLAKSTLSAICIFAQDSCLNPYWAENPMSFYELTPQAAYCFWRSRFGKRNSSSVRLSFSSCPSSGVQLGRGCLDLFSSCCHLFVFCLLLLFSSSSSLVVLVLSSRCPLVLLLSPCCPSAGVEGAAWQHEDVTQAQSKGPVRENNCTCASLVWSLVGTRRALSQFVAWIPSSFCPLLSTSCHPLVFLLSCCCRAVYVAFRGRGWGCGRPQQQQQQPFLPITVSCFGSMLASVFPCRLLSGVRVEDHVSHLRARDEDCTCCEPHAPWIIRPSDRPGLLKEDFSMCSEPHIAQEGRSSVRDVS